MFDGITNKGSEYLAKCQATGEGIKLVKVKIGDGRLLDSEDPTTFTDIKSIKKEVEVSEKTQIESNLRLVIEFNNEGVTTGYFPREIGIYALDGETEILYWYINDGDQTTWMPPAEKAPVKYKYGVNIMATNNETTLVNWTGKELWVDKEYLNKELAKKQDLNENRLLTTAKIIWEAINELFTNKLDKGGYTGTAQNLLTEISKKTSKTILGRIIIGKGLTADSDGRTSIISKNDGIIINENDIQLNTADNLTTDSSTKPLSSRQGKILNENKQNKEDSTLKTIAKTIVGAINEIYDELIKKASATQLGRMMVGTGLTADSNGRVSHSSGAGNNHIPANGASGNFLKWLSNGAAQWVNITWSDISGKPSSFTPSSHNHTKANITDFPTSMKNPNALTISLNGNSQGAYDGAAAKNINITPASIGAEPAFSKNGAFNKPFGTSSNTVLEGAKLAEILGLTYGGNLNTNSTKTVNYAYYDSTTKKVYKCIKATSINYADATYFEAISNNDLLGKFQNLDKNYEIIMNTFKHSGTFILEKLKEYKIISIHFTGYKTLECYDSIVTHIKTENISYCYYSYGQVYLTLKIEWDICKCSLYTNGGDEYGIRKIIGIKI